MLSTLVAAAGKYTHAGDPGREAAARFELGSFLFQLGRGGEAFDQLKRAAEILEQTGLIVPSARALLGCGHALTIDNRHRESLQWFDRAIQQFTRSRDEAGVLEASAAKLEALADLDQWADIELTSKIIDATELTGDTRLLTFRLVAFRYRTQARLSAGDLVGCLGPARKAADVASRLGDPRTEATFRLALAHNLRLLQEPEQAAEEYEQVLAVVSGLPGAAEFENAALEGLGATTDG